MQFVNILGKIKTSINKSKQNKWSKDVKQQMRSDFFFQNYKPTIKTYNQYI